MDTVTVNEMQTFFNRVCDTVTQHSQTVQEMQSAINQQNSRIDDLLRQVEGLKADLNQEIQANEQLRQDNQKVRQENEELTSMADTADKAKVQAVSELEALRNVMVERDRRVQELNQALDAANGKVSQLENEVQFHAQAREALEHSVNYHQSQVGHLQDALDSTTSNAEEGWRKYEEARTTLASIEGMFRRNETPFPVQSRDVA